jgi:hypothetical protein
VAPETDHSWEAVDRYVGPFDRVRHGRREGRRVEQTAYTRNGRRSLGEESLAIDEELESGPES